MPRPCLPDVFKRVRSMEVLLTKHTKNDVWAHFEDKFSTFAEKSEKYINKLSTSIQDFKQRRPYDRINWRKNHTCGGASNNRITPYMWNGYGENENEENEYDCLRTLHSDLVKLKEEFGGKDDYAKFVQQAKRFNDEMHELMMEYERLEKYMWECSYATWKEEDAEWIAETNEYRHHKNSHRTIEEQIANSNAWRNNYHYKKADDEDKFVPIDYTLTCRFCKQEAEKKAEQEASSAKFIAEMEETTRRSNEEFRRQMEEKRKAEEDAKREAWKNAPVLTCETCKYSTKSQSSYDQHTESKEHKIAVKMATLHCEKCNIYSRCLAEHQAHLHSKKHLGETEVEKKTLRCDICDYTAANKGNYEYHMNSKKHKKKAEDHTC